jgi:hypothetical protein
MGTDASTDQQPAALYGDPRLIETLELQTRILIALHERVKGIPQERTPFRLMVPSPSGAQTLSGAQLTSAHRGEILTVQNSNAAPATLLLVESEGAIVLNVVIPANDYKSLFVPFFGRLFAKSGAGVIVSGNVFS